MGGPRLYGCQRGDKEQVRRPLGKVRGTALAGDGLQLLLVMLNLGVAFIPGEFAAFTCKVPHSLRHSAGGHSSRQAGRGHPCEASAPVGWG